MATVTGHGDWVQKGVFRYTVTGMAGSDNSVPVDTGSFDERSVQVFGTVASETSITIQGRNSTSTDAGWNTMTTPSGGDVSFTAAGMLEIDTPAYQYRVLNQLTATTGVASDTDVTVVFLFRD
jgi:hypothetical protein